MENNRDNADFLIELILNNTGLNYDKDKLRMGDDTAILESIKVLAKDKYESRLKELQEKQNSKED